MTRDMSVFFFDIRIDEDSIRDEAGLEYPDAASALCDAKRSLPDLVAEALQKQAGSCSVTVRTQAGKILRRFEARLKEDSGPVKKRLRLLDYGG